MIFRFFSLLFVLFCSRRSPDTAHHSGSNNIISLKNLKTFHFYIAAGSGGVEQIKRERERERCGVPRSVGRRRGDSEKKRKNKNFKSKSVMKKLH